MPPPRPAASLILLRPDRELEVLVGRRPEHLRAFPGATVFPGGKIERQDGAWPDGDSDPLVPAAYATLRETFEETGLYLAVDGEGAGRPASEHAAARREVEVGLLDFQALALRWGRPVSRARLTPFARWITPRDKPHRFDTRFFLAEASTFEAGEAVGGAEFERLRWARPADLLADPEVRLAPPTERTLQLLAGEASPAAAIRSALARGVVDGGLLMEEGGALQPPRAER